MPVILFLLMTISIIITEGLLSQLCIGLGILWPMPFPELTASGKAVLGMEKSDIKRLYELLIYFFL